MRILFSIKYLVQKNTVIVTFISTLISFNQKNNVIKKKVLRHTLHPTDKLHKQHCGTKYVNWKKLHV